MAHVTVLRPLEWTDGLPIRRDMAGLGLLREQNVVASDYGAAMTRPPEQGHVVLRLSITGELGRMDYLAVLRALQGSYDLLQRTARRVIGDRADELHWHLTGLSEGSAVTLVRPDTTGDVTEHQLREIIETYTRDLADPAERLPEEDVPILRNVLQELQRTNSGALLAALEGLGDGEGSPASVVDPVVVLPTLVEQRSRRPVIGSVVGRLDSLNVHGKREASLWNELDQRRVVVTFAEDAYSQVYAALRRRVEVFGLVQEDADGRPLRVRLQDLELLARDEGLPTLRSLAGSMPTLTGALTPEDYLEQQRRGLGLA